MNNWQKTYFESDLRLMPLIPYSKFPYALGNRTDYLTGYNVWFTESIEQWNEFVNRHRLSNIGTYWPGVQVDMDSERAAMWGREHGITRNIRAWIIQTGRGYRVLFKKPDGFNLRSCVDPSHAIPDLLQPNSIAVLPPSLHKTGRLYRWLKGFSPLDIPISDLQEPPAPILEYWQSQKQPERHYPRVDRPPANWLGLVFEAIVKHMEATGRRLRPLSNGGFITTCPFHDDRDPSLTIHPERGYKCFAGCGKGRLTALAAKLGVRV